MDIQNQINKMLGNHNDLEDSEYDEYARRKYGKKYGRVKCPRCGISGYSHWNFCDQCGYNPFPNK